MTLLQVDEPKVIDITISEKTLKDNEQAELSTFNVTPTNKCSANAKQDKQHLLDAITNNKNNSNDNDISNNKKDDTLDDSDTNKGSKKKKEGKQGELSNDKQAGTIKTKASCCTIM